LKKNELGHLVTVWLLANKLILNMKQHPLILRWRPRGGIDRLRQPDGTQNNTGSGALIGGVFGALTGAAIGGRNHGGQDALIGAAAGRWRAA